MYWQKINKEYLITENRNHGDKQLVASTVPCFAWKATLGSCYWVQRAGTSDGRSWKALGKQGDWLHLSAQWEMRERCSSEQDEKEACEHSTGSGKHTTLSVECNLKEFLNNVSKTSTDQTHKGNKGAINETSTANHNAEQAAQTDCSLCFWWKQNLKIGKIMLDSLEKKKGGLLKVKNNHCNWKN